MIDKIFFDWYKGDKYNKSFGQITYVDKYDEKITVHNFDDISEEQFKSIFDTYASHNAEKTYVTYEYLF